MEEQYKWKIPKRKEANKEILSILADIIDKHPELRFGQILSIVKVVDSYMTDKHERIICDPFYEESVDTLKRVKEQYYGKDKV